MAELYTLEEAKQLLRDNWETGTDCPACGQYVKLYKRKINSAMAWVLIILYKRHFTDDGWVHVENYLKTQNTPASLRGDFPKLRFWGLLEQMAGEREDGSPRVGMYRLTEKGRQFVEGKITVPEKLGFFNQQIYKVDSDQVNIKQTLNNKFNYDELMKS